MNSVIATPSVTTDTDSVTVITGTASISIDITAQSWGWLPALMLTTALGLFVIALADNGARQEQTWSVGAFWIGLLAIILPIAMRLLSLGPLRGERIVLVVLLGLAFYAVKVMRSPLSYTFYDEFIHFRSATDVLSTMRLFSENPLLPVSSVFPGLENVTSAVCSLTGLSIFSAGILLVGVFRLLLMLALFLFYEQVSRSSRIASIGTLLYAANPSFLFLDVQFAYESLALPLAIFVLYMMTRRIASSARRRQEMTIAVLLGIGAVIVTHHLTSYALVAFMILLTVVNWFIRRRAAARPDAYLTVLVGLVGTLIWLMYVASQTIRYIGPTILVGVTRIGRFILGDIVTRQLFSSFSGTPTPLAEQLASYASVLLIVVSLVAVFSTFRRQAAISVFTLTLTITALGYPLSLPLRLTQLGARTVGRTWAFLFVGVAFMLATVLVSLWQNSGPWWRTRKPLLLACLGVVFIGQVVIGWPPTERLPGPFLISAQGRSVSPEGQAAADWIRAELGSGNAVTADRVNALLMGAYGNQTVILRPGINIDVTPLFFTTDITATDRKIIAEGNIHYLVADRRLTQGLPMLGIYVEAGEPLAFQHKTPLNPLALTKFDKQDEVSRLYDSGNITIYDIGMLADGQKKH